ncbi:zinc finger protein 91-like [Gigantopelta aegis]|uniref:zinc finger protein 91-like n=1 Tax=Gigantopelta aegis TaxID=1735272 RepID=UPI001B88D50C|nr:zinc finger protein 91-like [Gigantopelta aegis]
MKITRISWVYRIPLHEKLNVSTFYKIVSRVRRTRRIVTDVNIKGEATDRCLPDCQCDQATMSQSCSDTNSGGDPSIVSLVAVRDKSIIYLDVNRHAKTNGLSSTFCDAHEDCKLTCKIPKNEQGTLIQCQDQNEIGDSQADLVHEEGLGKMETDHKGLDETGPRVAELLKNKLHSPDLKGDDFSGYESLDDCFVTFDDDSSDDEHISKKKKRKAKDSDDDEYLPPGYEDNDKNKDRRGENLDNHDDVCDDSGNGSVDVNLFTVGDGVIEPDVVKISDGEYGCTYCPQVRSNIDDAKIHLLTHYDFQCQHCSKKYLRAPDLKVHIRKHRVTENFVCLFPECKFSANSKLGISKHMHAKHAKEKHFSCSWCTFSSKTVKAFIAHVSQTHYASVLSKDAFRAALCPTCGAEFKRNSDLKEHMVCHHGAQLDYLSVCDVCGLVVRSRRMQQHKIAKHRVKTIPCKFDGCRLLFKSDYRMETHYTRVHLGIFKYKCTYEDCSFACHAQGSLRNHLNMVHLKNRCFPCPCPGCGKSFFHKGHLAVHSRIHSDTKPLSCELCDYRCRQRAALNWHLQKKHPGEFDEQNSDVPTVSGDSSRPEGQHSAHPPLPAGIPALTHAKKQGRKGNKIKT